MFVRTKSTPNSPRKSIQVVENIRDPKTGKVTKDHYLVPGAFSNDARRIFYTALNLKRNLDA